MYRVGIFIFSLHSLESHSNAEPQPIFLVYEGISSQSNNLNNDMYFTSRKMRANARFRVYIIHVATLNKPCHTTAHQMPTVVITRFQLWKMVAHRIHKYFIPNILNEARPMKSMPLLSTATASMKTTMPLYIVMLSRKNGHNTQNEREREITIKGAHVFFRLHKSRNAHTLPKHIKK